jgi:Putative Ig domain
MSRRPTFIFLAFSMAIFGMALSGCGGGGGTSNHPISVSLSPSAAQAIDQGQTINFTASVANDSASKGVTWSQTGGALSGQTTTAATFTASGSTGSGSVTATSVADATKSATVSITVTAVPALNVPALPSATIGSAYSQKVSATGGAGTLTYSISSGTLPAGLTLSGSTISGTPTGPTGTANFTVKVTDSSTAGAMSATQQLGITVNSSVAALSITTTALPNGSVSGAYSFVLASTGGVAPVTWSITSGTLPTGLALTPSTGAITGTATTAGTASITFQVADSSTPPQTAKASLSLTIAQLMITTTSLLNPMVGEAYNQTVLYTDSGGTLPVAWSLASGSSLPAGFSLDPSSGAITGTATAGEIGTSNFTVQVTDSSVPTPQTATQALSLTITTATACGSGSESLLNGQYAMSLTGFDASGPSGLLASFTANGAGGITSGYEDINSIAGVQSNLSIVSSGSSYSLGSDRRGCLTLVTSSGTKVFRIAVGILNSGTPQVYTIGRSIEFDTTGTNVAGTIQIQYPNAFSNGAFQGNFAYTVQSPLNSSVGGGFFGSVGVLNLSGSSVTGEGDMNINGSVDPGNTGYPATAMPLTGGTYSISGTGRGTLSFSVPVNGTPTTINLVLYVLSTTQVYVMSSAAQSTTNGALNLFSGFAQQQSGSYNNASLNTPSVLFTSGQTAAGGAASRVETGVFTPDGNGNFTFSGDLNSGGMVSTASSSGTYAVDSTGRILITNSGGSGPAIVMYMGLPGYSYCLSTDANVMLGNAEPQTGTPFNNATLSGIYSFGTIVPVVPGSPLRAGEANYDGNGNLTITFDVNEGGFLSLDNVTTATYSVSSNGRVVSPAGGTTLTVSYIKSTGTVISFGYTSTDTNPTLQVMDQ